MKKTIYMINDKIPSEFELAGIKFKVIEEESILDDDKVSELYGRFDTNQNTISLAKTIYNEEVTPQTKLNTFYHELAHILQYYYNNGLDESFAQSVGNLLMQYSQTKK